MAFYNGTFNVRVWRIGTKRLLGVALVPDSISKKHPDGIYWMPAELSDTLTFGVQIFGDFDVCPLTRERSGAMQFVCVESAAHLLVKDYNKEPEQTYRLNDTTNR